MNSGKTLLSTGGLFVIAGSTAKKDLSLGEILQ